MSNPILDVIKSRRSIRKFKPELIKQSELEQILEAGNWAPSGHNEQPWHFTVVSNKAFLDEMNQDIKNVCKSSPNDFIKNIANNPGFNMFYGAPMVIFVCSLDNGITKVEDCSAATQNMLLAAESLDIGTCWNGFVTMGLMDNEVKKKYETRFNIPKNATIMHAIAIGYKDMANGNGPKRINEVYFNIIK